MKRIVRIHERMAKKLEELGFTDGNQAIESLLMTTGNIAPMSSTLSQDYLANIIPLMQEVCRRLDEIQVRLQTDNSQTIKQTVREVVEEALVELKSGRL